MIHEEQPYKGKSKYRIILNEDGMYYPQIRQRIFLLLPFFEWVNFADTNSQAHPDYDGGVWYSKDIKFNSIGEAEAFIDKQMNPAESIKPTVIKEYYDPEKI